MPECAVCGKEVTHDMTHYEPGFNHYVCDTHLNVPPDRVEHARWQHSNSGRTEWDIRMRRRDVD